MILASCPICVGDTVRYLGGTASSGCMVYGDISRVSGIHYFHSPWEGWWCLLQDGSYYESSLLIVTNRTIVENEIEKCIVSMVKSRKKKK